MGTTTFGDQLRQLCREGDVIAAKALLEGSPDALRAAQQDPASTASRLVLDHVSYLRGWTTLQLRLRHIVGSGPAALTRPTPDLLLISHPHSEALRRWVGSAARITELLVNPYRTELNGEPDPTADLSDNLRLPLDRYVDQAIEAITARALSLGAPLLLMQGSPWLAVAASAAAHRLGLPLWWDLRGDALAMAHILEGLPYSVPVPPPHGEAAFRAAASTARLVVDDDQVSMLRTIPELRDRLLVIGTRPHGAAPTFTSEWSAWRAVQEESLSSAPRHHYVGLLGAAASVSRSPRIAVIGSFEGFPHDDVVADPAEILPEEVDALVIDVRTPEAWALAKERAIQARTYHLPIVAIGLPAPPERPFADMTATIGPVPREARTSGHQPQWGFTAISDNPTGYRIALRAAGLQVGAPAFRASPARETRFIPLDTQLRVVIVGAPDSDPLAVTLEDLASQSLHPSLYSYVVVPPDARPPTKSQQDVVMQAGERLPADSLLNLWLKASSPVV